MTPIKCFMLLPTDRYWRSLRRYRGSDTKCSVNPNGYHNAEIPLDISDDPKQLDWPLTDERWPTHCVCGYKFEPADKWQLFLDAIWIRQDTNQEVSLRNPPPGAMWDATWWHDLPGHCGPDGRSLVCVLPDGSTWHIDSRCRNCTMPNDNVHKCWCRHGEPPNLTVDKNCNTCQAGAGSIQSDKWHGFLVNGYLQETR